MKAITVPQPYAALIVLGAVSYDLRSKQPPASAIGTRIAIHAASGPCDGRGDRATADYLIRQYGDKVQVLLQYRRAIIATAKLMAACQMTVKAAGRAGPIYWPGAVVADSPISTIWRPIDEAMGYRKGAWEWALGDIEIVAPYRCRGRQGLWEWTSTSGS